MSVGKGVIWALFLLGAISAAVTGMVIFGTWPGGTAVSPLAIGSPPPEFTPTPTATLPATPTPFLPLPLTPTFTPSLLPTHTPTATALPTATQTPSIPAEAYIDGIWGYPQTFNLSCESRSAADFARYFGVEVGELEFLHALPDSDDPDEGFVGDVNGYLGQLPPDGYGVHAGPVAALLREFGLPAEARKGMTLDEIKAEIAAGRPVMVWAISDMGAGTPVEYTSQSGATTVVARFEHTFIVIGYGGETLTVLDNERVYSVSTAQFMRSWSVLGKMGVVVLVEE